MKTLKVFRFALASIAISASLIACGPKDADIQKQLDANPALSGVTTAIKDGVVTLSGQVKDDASKAVYEAAAKAVKGVKSVVDNLTVAPPPAPAPVVIAADNPLTKSVTDAIKDLPTVKADVKDGIVTLTGDIKRDQLMKLMQTLNTLKPKKIVNQLTIK